jgi:ribonuclease P protein component
LRLKEDEKDIETCKQHASEKDPRLPGPHGHKRGKARPQPPAGQGAEKTGGIVLPAPDRPFPGKADAAQPMERSTFGKQERVRKRQDYLTVYRQGVRDHSRHFTCLTCRNPAGIRRLGITVGKKVGKAVKRNRIKRLIREFFRLHKQRFPASLDIVIMAKPRAALLANHEIMRELEMLVDRIKG